MDQIDFLPHGYRREHTRRRRQIWQFVAVVLVAGIIAAASLFQLHMAAQLQSRVEEMIPQYQLAQQRNKRLAELKIKLEDARDQAKLFTYLRHPWPKTQILGAIFKSLPKEVTLDKISIFRKLPSGARRQNIQSQAKREAEEKRLAALSPAARDLEQIKFDVDSLQTELTIIGTTNQPAALHEYVRLLGRNTFFSKTELESIESVKNKNNAHMKFELHILLKPGYGQPGGPNGSPIAHDKNTDHMNDSHYNETKS